MASLLRTRTLHCAKHYEYKGFDDFMSSCVVKETCDCDSLSNTLRDVTTFPKVLTLP